MMKNLRNNSIDPLLIAGASSNLFYSVAYPIVHTITVQGIDSNIMSLASLLSCTISAMITRIWIKYSKRLYKTFGIMLGLEAILYSLLTISFITGIASSTAYFMSDAIISALITRNIICAGTKLKSDRYLGESREIFDNKTIFYCNITSIIGYGFSFLVTLPTNLGFICMLIGIVIDNIFYYYVYRKESKSNEFRD